MTYKYNFYFKEDDYTSEKTSGNHPSFMKINVIKDYTMQDWVETILPSADVDPTDPYNFYKEKKKLDKIKK